MRGPGCSHVHHKDAGRPCRQCCRHQQVGREVCRSTQQQRTTAFQLPCPAPPSPHIVGAWADVCHMLKQLPEVRSFRQLCSLAFGCRLLRVLPHRAGCAARRSSAARAGKQLRHACAWAVGGQGERLCGMSATIAAPHGMQAAAAVVPGAHSARSSSDREAQRAAHLPRSGKPHCTRPCATVCPPGPAAAPPLRASEMARVRD